MDAVKRVMMGMWEGRGENPVRYSCLGKKMCRGMRGGKIMEMDGSFEGGVSEPCSDVKRYMELLPFRIY